MVDTAQFCSGSEGEVLNNSRVYNCDLYRSQLGSLKKSNIICCYIDTNSVRNKSSHLCELITGPIGTISITEIKPDSSFPIWQFLILGFHKPFKMGIDRRRQFSLRKVFTAIRFLTNFKLPDEAQIIPFELELKKKSACLYVTIKHHYKTVSISLVFLRIC